MFNLLSFFKKKDIKKEQAIKFAFFQLKELKKKHLSLPIKNFVL